MTTPGIVVLKVSENGSQGLGISAALTDITDIESLPPESEYSSTDISQAYRIVLVSLGEGIKLVGEPRTYGISEGDRRVLGCGEMVWLLIYKSAKTWVTGVGKLLLFLECQGGHRTLRISKFFEAPDRITADMLVGHSC